MKKLLKPRKNASQERSQETVNAILKATTHILTESESIEISTNKIAEKAGVSIGSLYQYFPGKESILNALLEMHLKRKHSAIFSHLSERLLKDIDSPAKAIEDFVDLLIDLKIKHLRLERALLYYFSSTGDFHTLRKFDDEIIKRINDFFLPLQSRLPGYDPEWSIFILFNTLRAVTISVGIQRPSEVKNSKFKRELVRMIQGYLLTEK